MKDAGRLYIIILVLIYILGCLVVYIVTKDVDSDNYRKIMYDMSATHKDIKEKMNYLSGAISDTQIDLERIADQLDCDLEGRCGIFPN